MSSLSLQSFSSSSTLSFFDSVPPPLGIPTTDDASLKIQQLPVKNLINQPKKGKTLLPGTCTVIGCPNKESIKWYRNLEAFEKTAKICRKCYMKTWYKKNKEMTPTKDWQKNNSEKVKAMKKACYGKTKVTSEKGLFLPSFPLLIPSSVSSFFAFDSLRTETTKNKDELVTAYFPPIEDLPHPAKQEKHLLPGVCTVIGCTKEKSSKWHQNKEALKQTAKMCNSCYMKVRYKKNPEKMKTRTQAWRKKNPEKARANDKASHERARAARKRQEPSSSLQSISTSNNEETSLSDWEKALETFRSEENNCSLLDRFSDSELFDFIQEVPTLELDFPPS